MAQVDGCVVTNNSIEWEVTGTADTSYVSGILSARTETSPYPRYRAYCLITAESPGTVHVKGTERDGRYLSQQYNRPIIDVYWNLTVDENGSFDAENWNHDEPVTLPVDVNTASFEEAHAYAAALYEAHADAFHKIKDWMLSEDCRAYYKVGPYPEEVRKSLCWTETRNLWGEHAEIYRSAPVYDALELLFTTYRICDIAALNADFDINLYEKPAEAAIFGILSEQYENEDALSPPPVGYREKLVSILYTGTETYEADEYDVIEALGDGWYLGVQGYDNVRGDMNGDGILDSEDVKLLQAWLTGVPDIRFDNWRSADLNGDGILNAADLSMMKQRLMQHYAESAGKINVTEYHADSAHSTEVKAKIADKITETNPDFPFSDFTFRYMGGEPIYKSVHDNLNTIGTIQTFYVYYQDVLLNHHKYQLTASVYDDGRFEMDCDFLQTESVESLAQMHLTPAIDPETAIQTAMAYADGLDVIYNSEIIGQYTPSERFGKYTNQVIYDIGQQIFTYQIWDTSTLEDDGCPWAVHLDVYVDALTGAVTGHAISAEPIFVCY